VLDWQVSGVNLPPTRQIWTKIFIKTTKKKRCILTLTGETRHFFMMAEKQQNKSLIKAKLPARDWRKLDAKE